MHEESLPPFVERMGDTKRCGSAYEAMDHESACGVALHANDRMRNEQRLEAVLGQSGRVVGRFT